MIAAGFFVAVSLLVMLARMPWRWKMRVISNATATDLIVFVLLTILHWGTFSGVMAATIGALMCSLVLGLAAKLVGCYKNGSYKPGVFDVSNKLGA